MAYCIDRSIWKVKETYLCEVCKTNEEEQVSSAND